MKRLMVAALLIAGCDDGNETKPDTSSTTTSPDTTEEVSSDAGDTSDDTSEPTVETDATSPGDTTDTTPDGDVNPGGNGTVTGTPLEGVVVERPAIALCSAWNEGASLADEQARKVRISVDARPNATLDEVSLRQPFPFALVEVGPNRADRTRVVFDGVISPEWTLSSGDTSLYATIEHALGTGTLTESYFVSRGGGGTAPVVADGRSPEVRFFYKKAGSALEWTALERCELGPEDVEPAVTVVIAQDAGKKKWGALVRYWRTVDMDAGSYPVVMLGHRFIHSDNSYFSEDAFGFWTTSYAAQHHNHDEAIDVDFKRDLGNWHTVFKDPDPLATDVKRVRIEGLRAGVDGATMTIERLNDTGAPEVLDVPNAMVTPRVDANFLKRNMTCGNPQVLAAGGADHWFQMLLCPEGPELGLVGIVPVIWGFDITRSGTLIDGQAIVAVTGGWDVTIGDFQLNIRRQDEGAYSTEVFNVSGESVQSAWETGYVLGEPPEVWQMPVTGANQDGTISFAIGRSWAGYGIGKSQLWAPTYFELTFGGKTYRVDAWDALDYTNTHHNWADTLEAVTDDGTIISWRTAFMDDVPNEVGARSATGEILLAPTIIGPQD